MTLGQVGWSDPGAGRVEPDSQKLSGAELTCRDRVTIHSKLSSGICWEEMLWNFILLYKTPLFSGHRDLLWRVL